MAEPVSRLTGLPLALSVLGAAVMGGLLGIVSAFLVPTGPRLGVRNGILPVSASPTGLQAASPPLAPVAASNGTLLSLGVALAFAGCLGLGLLVRVLVGERLVALAPVSAWLVIALLALSEVHGDLVLPTTEPGVVFLYAGVLGGALSLLPRGMLTALTSARR